MNIKAVGAYFAAMPYMGAAFCPLLVFFNAVSPFPAGRCASVFNLNIYSQKERFVVPFFIAKKTPRGGLRAILTMAYKNVLKAA